MAKSLPYINWALLETFIADGVFKDLVLIWTGSLLADDLSFFPTLWGVCGSSNVSLAFKSGCIITVNRRTVSKKTLCESCIESGSFSFRSWMKTDKRFRKMKWLSLGNENWHREEVHSLHRWVAGCKPLVGITFWMRCRKEAWRLQKHFDMQAQSHVLQPWLQGILQPQLGFSGSMGFPHRSINYLTVIMWLRSAFARRM